MITAPSNPRRSRSSPSMIRARLRRRALGVERRIGGVRDHHQLEPGVDRGPERLQSRRSSSARDASIELGPRSVLAVARPRPGKCLAVAATPSACSAVPKATPSAATRPASRRERPRGDERPVDARARRAPARGRRRCRARASARPVARPSARGRGARRRRRSRPAERSGGRPGRRSTSPPSWSIATSGAGAPARAAARAQSLDLLRRAPAGSVPSGGNRITPPISPRADALAQALGRGRLHPHDQHLPGEPARIGRDRLGADGRRLALDRGAGPARRRRRRRRRRRSAPRPRTPQPRTRPARSAGGATAAEVSALGLSGRRWSRPRLATIRATSGDQVDLPEQRLGDRQRAAEVVGRGQVAEARSWSSSRS